MEANLPTSSPIVGEGEPLFVMDFPPEIHLNMLECADVCQYSTLRLVCKRWYGFIENTLPLGRYVPAKIEFKNEPKEESKESPPPGICMDPSLWLTHRAIFIFSRFRIDPKAIKMDRITVGLDFVNARVRNRIQKLEANGKIVDTALAGVFKYIEPMPISPSSPGLLCGRRDISHYLSEPVYIVNPRHPESKKYQGLVEILQDWKFTPGPISLDLDAQSCPTVRHWMELFLDRYDWADFDETLKKSNQTDYGLYTSSMEIAARVTAPFKGCWKEAETKEGEEEGKSSGGYCLEILTKVCILGCRFQKEGQWVVARSSSPTGFTFDET
ncbi:hypothetical protein TWF788_007507 [Orbilia oligospora]|uniref:F-box domain-containing protein n=1 Tax=Orbilia oligospora TaxID=2813651 RepID=A0A7C8U2S6_ORBOL|nr:hypothetical protein TWF788_007507 [Orbilia oligospora]